MKVLYSDQEIFTDQIVPSIFLAGPTPRSIHVPSWRPDAIKILDDEGFDGVVLVPERRVIQDKIDYTDQVEWEYSGLSNCTAIVFWVPREMATMPALTTNVEFGYWIAKAPEKVIYGRPPSAVSTRYLDWMYSKTLKNGIQIADNLVELMVCAMEFATQES